MHDETTARSEPTHFRSQSPLQVAGGATKRNHFKLHSMSELMSMNIEPNWLIEDYIEKDTTGVLYGPSGSYKTFLALDWSLSIALNQSWHGHDVNQGMVVYVAGEGNHGLQKRIKAWLLHHRYEDTDNSTMSFMASNQRVAVLNADELSVFRHQLDEINQPIKLIVFDTLRKCFGQGDENHSKDMGQFLDQIEAIKHEYETTCLIVHHTNKARVIRGSNALESDVDFVYRLDSRNNGSCVLHAEKLKDSDPPRPMQFDMMSVDVGNHNGNPINSLVPQSTDYQYQQEITKPSGIRGVVFDYITTNYDEPVLWTELTTVMLNDDSIIDHDKLNKTNIRSALNGLKDANTAGLCFDKMEGQNAVRVG